MFWPPRLPSRLPPTNAIAAVPHQAASSPVTSTSSTRAARSGPSISRRLRRCQATPDADSSPAISSDRSACRGTRISRRAGRLAESLRNVSIASDSSGAWVLPARKTTSSAVMPASSATFRTLSELRSPRAPSYFIEPATITSSAPSERKRSASSRLRAITTLSRLSIRRASQPRRL